MTDNGLAALAERLKPYQMPDPWTDDLRTVVMVGTAEEVAAAILGPRGVFLPDGLPEFKPESPDQWASPAEWQWLVIENAERVAALRDLREWITTQGDYRDPSLYNEGWNDAMTAVLDLIDGEWAP